MRFTKIPPVPSPFTKKLRVTALLTALAAMSAVPTASAVLIAYEGFDFSGAVIGNGSGTGWGTNTWTGVTNFTTATGLEYTNAGGTLETTGSSIYRVSGSTGAHNVVRNLETAVARTSGTELWVSFLADQSASSHHNVTFLNSGGNEMLGFGQVHNMGSSSYPNYAIRDTAGASVSSIPTVTTPAAEPQLLVLHISIGAGDSITSRLYLNPTLGTTPDISSAIVSKTTNISTGTHPTFSRIRLEIGASTSNFMDEIRIGTTFADVAPIPEPQPGVVALLGLAAALFIRRRGTSR